MNCAESSPIDEEEISSIFDKIFNMKTDNDVKLAALLKFLSSNQFEENIDFSSIYTNHLINLEISAIYIYIIIQLIIISKKTEMYANFICYLKEKTNFIYEDCFWVLCLFFRQNEDMNSSNILYDMGITKIIEMLIDQYEVKNIKLSIIELIFKVLLSVITSENLFFIQQQFLPSDCTFTNYQLFYLVKFVIILAKIAHI